MKEANEAKKGRGRPRKMEVAAVEMNNENPLPLDGGSEGPQSPTTIPYELTVRSDSKLTWENGEISRQVVEVAPPTTSSDAGLDLATLHLTDPLISLAEMARRINKDRATVWRWARDGLFSTSRAPSGLQSVRTSVANTFLGGTAIKARV